MVAYMCLSPVFRRLGDKVSRWVLVGVAVILWSLATGGTGLATGYLMLFLTRCLVGVGEAAYGPVAPAMLSDLYPVDHRGPNDVVVLCGDSGGQRAGVRDRLLAVGHVARLARRVLHGGDPGPRAGRAVLFHEGAAAVKRRAAGDRGPPSYWSVLKELKREPVASCCVCGHDGFHLRTRRRGDRDATLRVRA